MTPLCFLHIWEKCYYFLWTNHPNSGVAIITPTTPPIQVYQLIEPDFFRILKVLLVQLARWVLNFSQVGLDRLPAIWK